MEELVQEAPPAQKGSEPRNVVVNDELEQLISVVKDEQQNITSIVQEIMEQKTSAVKNELVKISSAIQNELRSKLQELKTSALGRIEEDLTEEIDRVLLQFSTAGNCTVDSATSPSRRRDQHGNLPEKILVQRNSVLTDMWATPHFHSFYNICTAMLLFLILNSTLLYILDSSLFAADREFLVWCFGSVSIWGSIWFGMNFAILLVLYPLFRFWALSRKPSSRITAFDYAFLFLYISFFSAFFALPAYVVIASELPPVSSFFVLIEQTRMAMKIYAFVRQNIPNAIFFKPHQDGDKLEAKEPCPEFQKLLYFLFAPTLVYRDEYPRTRKIAWDSVAWYFLQTLTTILVMFIAFRRFVVEVFASAGREHFTPEYLILVFSGSILSGTMAMFLGFYGFLHCWLNAFAEMLTFADRQFYLDWWNSTTFGNYYRTWNIVVHDFIYGYIYRDFYTLWGKRQIPAMVAVFAISAIIHEYILALTLKFFYPVLSVFFVMNSAAVVINRSGRKKGEPRKKQNDKSKTFSNVLLWFGLFLGWALMIILYSTEWYSRRNCPQTKAVPWDYFIPRSWTCKMFHSPFEKD